VERILEFQALPKLRDEAQDEALRQAFEQHLEETRNHVERVEQAMRNLRVEPASARNAALECMLQQHEEQAGNVKEPALRDLFHAGGAVRTEHLELALYSSLVGLAQRLGHDDVADLLEQNRKDEDQALQLLEALAPKLRAQL
jgi:ferritin-like metal-binding protein YciE